MRKPSVKSGRGGARKGAGAPTKEDKKVSIGSVYVKESEVEAVGGKEQARVIAQKAIERKARK